MYSQIGIAIHKVIKRLHNEPTGATTERAFTLLNGFAGFRLIKYLQETKKNVYKLLRAITLLIYATI